MDFFWLNGVWSFSFLQLKFPIQFLLKNLIALELMKLHI